MTYINFIRSLRVVVDDGMAIKVHQQISKL